MITLSLFIVHWLSLFSVENTSNDIISLKLQVPMKWGSALSGKTNYPITIHSKIKEWWWQLLPKMEQLTFCKMGVSMIWKFSLVISLMIRLNLLKYSYIIRPEVQRCFYVFVARQYFNGNVSSNHIKPVHPFTSNIYKIVLTTKYSHTLLSSSKIQRT